MHVVNGIAYAGDRPKPCWGVKAVEPLGGHRLRLRFADHTERIFDITPLLDEGVFERLRDEAFFMKARVDGGTVVWDDMLDIAPETLYEQSTPVGCDYEQCPSRDSHAAGCVAEERERYLGDGE